MKPSCQPKPVCIDTIPEAAADIHMPAVCVSLLTSLFCLYIPKSAHSFSSLSWRLLYVLWSLLNHSSNVYFLSFPRTFPNWFEPPCLMYVLDALICSIIRFSPPFPHHHHPFINILDRILVTCCMTTYKSLFVPLANYFILCNINLWKQKSVSDVMHQFSKSQSKCVSQQESQALL